VLSPYSQPLSKVFIGVARYEGDSRWDLILEGGILLSKEEKQVVLFSVDAFFEEGIGSIPIRHLQGKY
jgi:hypothetical protein